MGMYGQSIKMLCLSVVLSSPFIFACEMNDEKGITQNEISKLNDLVGSFSFAATINMAAIGQPGVEITFKGTSTSQPVLDKTGILSVSLVDKNQSVNYMGYRNDSKEFFSISLDPNQTALGYMSGKLSKAGTIKLIEPTIRMTSDLAFNSAGNQSTFKLPNSPVDFVSVKSIRTGNESVDVLKRIMSGPLKPERVNRKSTNQNPGENYARSHELLQKFVGNFTAEGGLNISSRLVADGRYAMTHYTGSVEMLAFIAYNNAGRFFQYMAVGADFPDPVYLQGTMQADGTILFADPFDPSGKKMSISFSPNGGYSATVSVNGKDIEKKNFVPTK